MNELSWLLYLSDVVPTFSTVFGIFFFLGIFASAVAIFLRVILSVERHKDTEAEAYWPAAKRASAWVVTITAISMLITLLTPSRQTILLIAASEAGETVVASDRGQELLDKINAALDAQLDSLAAK